MATVDSTAAVVVAFCGATAVVVGAGDVTVVVGSDAAVVLALCGVGVGSTVVAT